LHGISGKARPVMVMTTPEMVQRRIRRLWVGTLVVVTLLVGAAIAAYELIASPLQAMFLAGYGKRLTYQTASGPSDSIRFPGAGPYDIRLGYVGLPEFSKRLTERGFAVTSQARISGEMAQLADYGLFLPYAEKSVAGLTLLDCGGKPYYRQNHPRQAYANFPSIPNVVANTLLFIENRELLDPNHPQRNPAVEWDRLAQAVLEKVMQIFHPERNVPGGSTLATQIEKYRHSPDGLTQTASDKLLQMASASVRAYLEGSDTRASRRRIVMDYLNTVPLAAAPGYGEVYGIGDGLAAWFGLDFEQSNALLRAPNPTPEAAKAYKHVLALLISQRRPSWFLLSGRGELNQLADAHLQMLASVGVITPAFRDLALRQPIVFRSGQDKAPAEPVAGQSAETRPAKKAFTLDKATNALRIELAQLLGVPRLYDLDRLDLTVSTSLYSRSQTAIADFLRRLDDPVVVEAAGLYGEKLLRPDNDLKKVLYSFTLYELTEDGAQMRVQADSLNQPFDINQGAKLDMGSSAKLRTLITYLEIIAELHASYAQLDAAKLAAIPVNERDHLSRWALDYLSQRPVEVRGLEAMLAAAMGRTYSASPGEAFFTGGGLHTFANFNKDDNSKVMDLWEATRNSVNLPFIRLMRDIVRHFMYRAPSTAGQVLADVENPQRRTYLMRFADKEGQQFLRRFYKKYKGLKPEDATAALLNHLTANPKRLAAVYRYLDPKADPATVTAFLKSRLSNPAAFDEGDYEYLYETYGPDKFNLSDRGYIAQIHPLELWLVSYLRAHPKAEWKEIINASAKERVEVYDWLFKTGRKNAQDNRIQSLIEIEAFQEIHQRWRRLGYPFSSLVPSYASAIGSSADRPAALAELMGVILNDGQKLPVTTLNQLEFGAGTPYHTVLKRAKPTSTAVFPAPVARVIRQALVNVVQEGTARRLRGTFPTADGELVIGGKTGTGDHRYETYAANGAVLESKVVNRVATFAFFMGSRYYGVITAFVPGEDAGDYEFTSGLPVQLLKTLAPALRQLVVGQEQDTPSWQELVAAFEAENPPPPPAASKPAPPSPPATGPDTAPAAKAPAPPGKAAPSTKPAEAAARPREPGAKPPAAAVPANAKAKPTSPVPVKAPPGPAKPVASSPEPPAPPPPAEPPATLPAPPAPAEPPKPAPAKPKPRPAIEESRPGEGFVFQ
jgi:membrane peptidoglycan carboxypeptidase